MLPHLRPDNVLHQTILRAGLHQAEVPHSMKDQPPHSEERLHNLRDLLSKEDKLHRLKDLLLRNEYLTNRNNVKTEQQICNHPTEGKHAKEVRLHQ